MIIDVGPSDLLPDLIASLKEQESESVTIRFDAASSLLLTANEFRALAIAADRENVPIVLETADPLRRQLATLFGIPVLWPEDVEPEAEPEPISALAELAADQAETQPDLPAEPAEEKSVVMDTDAGDSNARHRRRLFKWLVGFATAAVLAAMIAGGYWWFFGNATVTVTPELESVSSNINLTVVDPGVTPPDTGGIVVTSNPISFDLKATVSSDATGEEKIGQDTATGELVLRNPGGDPVVIPAGQRFTTLEGGEYVLADAVTVPPATPESAAGEVTVEIQAATPGTDGNLDIGLLSGKLDNGVYFSNRTTAIEGGTDQTLQIVSTEDVDALKTDAEAALRSLASSSDLGGNLRVVPSTLTVENIEYTFDHDPGEEAAKVTVQAQATFTAQAFDSTGLDSLGANALRAETETGYELAPKSIVFGIPTETDNGAGVRSLIIPVSGDVAPTMNEARQEELARTLAGMKDQEARETVKAMPGIEDVEIEYSPSWLPHRLPHNSSRITIEQST